ncbi:hypothetical protein N1851_019370 [Merluccius polli]|uniref:Uncharacterized protein n=1 Tax=Merluccius polli TaxID=89951 RepID=A0AA47MLR3_MERPO|nr:hypothetical protein N1851_019370 [Merluccius polli]
MTAVHSFQRKLEVCSKKIFKETEHLQEQIQGDIDVSPHVDLQAWSSRGFSKGGDQTFQWAHAGSLQMELINLQANVALRQHFGVTDPATFWLQTVSETVFSWSNHSGTVHLDNVWLHV